MNFTDNQIKDLIKGIEDGSIDEWNLPKNYYKALVEYLSKGVLEGFSATIEDLKDNVLLQELTTNVHMFGAAKTYQEVQAMNALLVDEEGVIRSSREFNKVARELYDNWNDNWGRTEYNTAVGQSQMASKWSEIEKQKDIMGSLLYSAIVDATTSDICLPLDGMVAKVDDPIWDKVSPLNHFNCRCVLLQVNDEDTMNNSERLDQVEPLMNPIFINNPGKTGEIFTKDHPYFEVDKEAKDYAKRNFDLPLPKFE